MHEKRVHAPRIILTSACLAALALVSVPCIAPALAEGGVNASSSTETSADKKTAKAQKAAGTEEVKAKTAAAPAPPPFPVGNRFSRSVQKYTGLTWVTDKLAGGIAKIVLRKELGGNVRVRVRSFSFTDLLSGKVKSVDLDLKNSKIEDIGLGSIHVTTTQPVWYKPFKRGKRARGLQQAICLELKGELTDEDVSTALASPTVSGLMRGLKLDLPGLGDQELQIIEPHVAIKKGLLDIDVTLITKGAKKETGVPVRIKATPEVVDRSDIYLRNLSVESDCIVEPEKFAKFLSDLINPVVRCSRFDKARQAFRINTLEITEGKVTATGSLVLAPKPQQQKNDIRVSKK